LLSAQAKHGAMINSVSSRAVFNKIIIIYLLS
jgi:hypothetical protein